MFQWGAHLTEIQKGEEDLEHRREADGKEEESTVISLLKENAKKLKLESKIKEAIEEFEWGRDEGIYKR